MAADIPSPAPGGSPFESVRIQVPLNSSLSENSLFPRTPNGRKSCWLCLQNNFEPDRALPRPMPSAAPAHLVSHLDRHSSLLPPLPAPSPREDRGDCAHLLGVTALLSQSTPTGAISARVKDKVFSVAYKVPLTCPHHFHLLPCPIHFGHRGLPTFPQLYETSSHCRALTMPVPSAWNAYPH